MSDSEFVQRFGHEYVEDLMWFLGRLVARRFGLAFFFPALTLIRVIRRCLRRLGDPLMQRANDLGHISVREAKIFGGRSDQRMRFGTESTLFGNDRHGALR